MTAGYSRHPGIKQHIPDNVRFNSVLSLQVISSKNKAKIHWSSRLIMPIILDRFCEYYPVREKDCIWCIGVYGLFNV